MLANQGGLEPFFDQPLARPRDRVDTALQGRRDLAVAPALTTLRGVGFQQDPGLQQLLCWMVSAMDKGGEMLSLLIAQCHYVFLYRDLFPGHRSALSAATEPSNQTNTADSMTGATSLSRRGVLFGGGPIRQKTRLWVLSDLDCDNDGERGPGHCCTEPLSTTDTTHRAAPLSSRCMRS